MYCDFILGLHRIQADVSVRADVVVKLMGPVFQQG